MESASLAVCLCVDNADECVVALNEIAAGHVFGAHQHLKLLLHGQDKESLCDLVLSTQESCYHLVDEVTVASATLEHYDVAIVLLSQNSLQFSHKSCYRDSLSLISYIITVSNFIGGKISNTSKILVLGPNANMAATILSRALGCSGGNQLLAFQTRQNNGCGTDRGHQYKTAYTLGQTVSKWWAGTKDTPESKRTKAGIKIYGRKSSIPIHDGGFYFSVPVNVVGEKTFKIDPICYIDTEELKRVVFETERICREMMDITKCNEENDDIKVSGSHL